MGFKWIFTNDDYVHNFKKERQRRIKQAKIPKPPPDHNGSKSIPGMHPIKFQKAKNLDKS